ncbi:hypothetical protein H105_06826 [Trichophyton soudanense CBS 452.61]|uniref:Uncharacterized protein n=1 Tax=Trichophyton soudanense CBS 452.61 TaxID=1215331 RepID=A0A022XKU6_TRISD|nr:hypothetical protein H105_06826 [Trichophyton soudanense CBS 452.61]EZG03156.1 hypothetical protein H106_06657 [Trichophyton rubrum CBS 735.88]
MRAVEWAALFLCFPSMGFATSQYSNHHPQHVDYHHPATEDLKEAALGFFRLMDAAGFGKTRSVVFGAASIRMHFPSFRSTPDLDIIVYEENDLRLDRILNEMQKASNDRLVWGGDKESLHYILNSGKGVYIDVGYLDFGERIGISMLDSAAAADTILTTDSIPLATPEEMFIVKICASGTRSSVAQSLQDIADAEFIAKSLYQVNLVGDPLEPALSCLNQFLPESTYGKVWWDNKLGLSKPRKCTFHDWFMSNQGWRSCDIGILQS